MLMFLNKHVDIFGNFFYIILYRKEKKRNDSLLHQLFCSYAVLTLLFSPTKELNTSFEEWEKLMRAPNPGATETVMGLITRIFKQTAIAKVLIAGPSCVCLVTNYLMYFNIFT